MAEKVEKSHRINMASLPDLIGYNLRCAQVTVFQHFNKTIGETEISPPQYGALALINANPGISQSAIASALSFDRSTLVQIIDRLEDRKLVVREVSATDRRSHALKLTNLGQSLSDLHQFRREGQQRCGFVTQQGSWIRKLVLIKNFC